MTYRVRRLHHAPPTFPAEAVLTPSARYLRTKAPVIPGKPSLLDSKDRKDKRRRWWIGSRYRALVKALRPCVPCKWYILCPLLVGFVYLVLRLSLSAAQPGFDNSSKSPHSARHMQNDDGRAPLPAHVMSERARNHTLANGLLPVDMNSTVHPIYQLIRDAREEWDRKNARQSKTLLPAVREYRRRYGRQPPQGFDKWWAYVCENDVPLPDEYDQIHYDIAPFFAFSAGELRKRVEEMGETRDTFQFEDDIVGAEERLLGQVDLLKPIARWLPDLTAVYTVHDTPSQFIGWDYRRELLERAEEEDCVNPDDPIDMESSGWEMACPASSVLRSELRRAEQESNAAVTSETSFIADHPASMNPCDHPLHTVLHGTLLSRYPTVGQLKPLFTLSKTPLHADILAVPTEQYMEEMVDVPWEDKDLERLLWRGSNTGASYHAGEDYSLGHRLRLVDLANRYSGTTQTILPSPGKMDGHPIGKKVGSFPEELLNVHFLDIAFTGEPIQCNHEDGTCEELRRNYKWLPLMTHESALWYKFVLDVDGNAWSARFQRLLISGSLVFKSTIMPEWWTNRIQPWVHYIPIKLDYSDLFDALSFFRGDLFGRGGEDDLARDIAEAGQEWAATHWRREDMTAYLFRLYLEWGRVVSDRRENMDFVYHPSMEVQRE